MSNTYFQFKQFTIHQANTPMKVGTDGVLLGAWTDISKRDKILDVGAGTGLLSLMLAQRNPKAFITAVEIDRDSYIEAKENIEQSIFKQRIELFHTSFQDYNATDKYDLVICNPPFFKPTYLSGDEKRDVARQRINFEITDFFEFTFNITNEEGEVVVVYPFEQLEYITKTAAAKKFFIKRQCLVKGNHNKTFKRVLLQFSKQEEKVELSELCIENERHQYTDEFTELVKGFYLNV